MTQGLDGDMIGRNTNVWFVVYHEDYLSNMKNPL